MNNYAAGVRARYEAAAAQCKAAIEVIYNQFVQCVRLNTDYAVNATANASYFKNCTTIPTTTAAPTTLAP